MNDKSPTPSYYQRRIGGVLLDPYRIARLYGMADDALFSAMKKLLAAGQRGAKDKAQDVQDAIDALLRWQEMEREDVARASANEKEVFSTEYRKEFEAAFEQTVLPMPSTEHDGVSSNAVFLTGQSAPAGMEDAPGNEVVELPPDYATNVESMARVVFSMDGVESEGKRPKKTLFVTTPGGEAELRWSPPDDREMTATEVEELRQTVRRLAPEHAANKPITDDDAEDAARVERCETCDAKVTTNRQGCPICGAPTCCYSCCSREELKRQLDEARARIAALERERAEKAERELTGVVDPEQLQRWRTALSASPTETLTNAICRVTSDLAALRDRCRPRRQIEEPAPAGVPVLSWSHSDKKCDLGVWFWRMGENVPPDGIWTHQPPAPEAEREGE